MNKENNNDNDNKDRFTDKNLGYEGDVLVGGYEYTFDCPKCGEFTFVESGLSYLQDPANHRRRNDKVDAKNDEEVKVNGEYWCANCNTEFKLKLEKNELNDLEELDGYYLNTETYDRYEANHKDSDGKYHFIRCEYDSVKYDEHIKNLNNFVEISEDVYNIDFETWEKTVEALEEESIMLSHNYGDYIVNCNGARGEITGVYENDNKNKVVQIEYKTAKYKAEEDNVSNKLFSISDDIYDIDEDVWDEILDVFNKSGYHHIDE